jgi:peptidoglycan hydrolase-like protein with peptidoglycan-binding domain
MVRVTARCVLRRVAMSASLLVVASAGVTPAPSLAAATPTPTPSAPVPVAGSVKLALQHVGGNPPFAFAGSRVTVRGVVTPYVGGQTVKASFYRDGRKVSVQIVDVRAIGSGAGRFSVSYRSSAPGLVQARVTHYATAQQAAFSERSPSVRYVQVNLGPGSQGPSVRLLQSELDVLHYAVPLTGFFDEGTGRALIAYRKMTGLERIPYAGHRVFELLARRAGSFHVRYPGDGRHVEADLTKQVLAEIEPGGRVRTIYEMSSGKPSTPTVIGRFQVYSKTPGFNSKGMFESNYFIRGYAIHGYAEVPTFPASHGCLRVPIPDAPAIYAWVRLGTRVDVYND